MEWIQVNDYDAVAIDIYKDKISIVGGQVAKNDAIYTKWAIASQYDRDAGGPVPMTKKNGSYQAMPVKVMLGNTEQALDNLDKLRAQIIEIIGQTSEETSDYHRHEDPDVPF